jgi:WD40 repeat protein
VREALITARLEHPGIVPVYEAGRWPDGTPFYAMKLVAGRSLRELIARSKTVEDRLGLLHHVIAVADAIAYAHGRNIIHRDLKPANVIVGDFGETIVIDWGLAKDLSASEEASVGGGPFRSQRDDDLTSTGSVLGTPAYMAPEQERGEPVDQRADVYAIGTMLWQLCSLEKLPPGESDQRRHLRRRAGIDPDLAAIILKALEPEAARRYPDAGALAADLKAFKAGARIGARRYSLIALLAHWTRRHRALAVSLAGALVLAAAGTTLYVRGIAAERDRVRAANDALVLQQARLLLRTDPTAASDLMATYRGDDTTRHALLRAEAQGLGLARLRATPHTQGIQLAQPLADGALLTLGWDGTVAMTSARGASRVIAQGALADTRAGYTAKPGLLAYACEATGICVLDLRAERMRPPPSGVAAFAPADLAFSPSGRLLAASSVRGDIAIWQVETATAPTLQLQAHFDHGGAIAFVDDATVAMLTGDRIHIFDLDASGHAAGAGHELAIRAASDLATSSELHVIAVTTADGELVVIDSRTDQIVQRQTVCQGYLPRAAVLPGRSAIAYACRRGDVGLWDLTSRSASQLTHVDGGAASVAGSADGRYVIAGGINGSVVIHDATTGMVTSYLGHGSSVLVVQPPSPGFPLLSSGDASGELRTWPLPDATAQVVLHTTGKMFRAVALAGDGPVIAIGSSPTIPWYRGPDQSGELPGHNPVHDRVAVSRQQPRFVAFGLDDELELWSFDGQPASRTFRTHHGAVVDVIYAPDAPVFTVAHHDGSLEEWSGDGEPSRELGSIHEPIAFLVAIPGGRAMAVVATSGALWLADGRGLGYLGRQPGAIASVAASRDARWLAIANPLGVVHLYDLRTRALSIFSSPHPSSQYLEFTPDSTALAIATNKGVSLRPVPHATQTSGAASGTGAGTKWSWNEIELPVRHVGFSPDGAWFAAITDRGVWFQQRKANRWTYHSTGAAKIPFGYFTADGRRFVATDIGGRALVFDMRAGTFEGGANE